MEWRFGRNRQGERQLYVPMTHNITKDMLRNICLLLRDKARHNPDEDLYDRDDIINELRNQLLKHGRDFSDRIEERLPEYGTAGREELIFEADQDLFEFFPEFNEEIDKLRSKAIQNINALISMSVEMKHRDPAFAKTAVIKMFHDGLQVMLRSLERRARGL
ncbi:MAG: hypothetical protein GY847_01695 [Proteobacteria bacterium]|nr:hypothetical protein [Pseudomonadota bacterium]